MKKILITFFSGFIAGIILALFITREAPVDTEGIAIKQISGKKIIHKDFQFKNNSLFFKTEAEGKGVIETTFPKTMIPEARAWIEKKNAIQVDYSFIYHDKELHSIYGISYYRRWGSLSIGAGLKLSKDYYGLNAGVQYWF